MTLDKKLDELEESWPEDYWEHWATEYTCEQMGEMHKNTVQIKTLLLESVREARYWVSAEHKAGFEEAILETLEGKVFD